MRKILSKILLAAGILGSAGGFGQSPGGVSNPVVWLKADAGTNTTTSAASVSAWTNYGSSGGSAGQLSTLTLPTFQRGAHNFNPAIVDGVANANGALVLTNVFPSFAQRSLSTFVLQSQPDVTQTRSFVSFVNPSSWDVPYLGNLDASRFWFYWDGSYQAYVTLPNSLKRVNNTPSINGYYLPQWTTNPHTTTLSMNGAQATASGNSSAGTGVGQSLYISNDGGNNVASSGSISEIITFDRVLNDNEKQRVNSYLAVKYGISLLTAAGTALPDYLSSNSTVIWNATANATYNSNIAGIGFDAGSALNQKQSMSVNAGKQLLIGTTGLADDNQANATALTDGQYLLWGDNGLAKTPAVQLSGVANLNYRFGAIWKAKNTGSVGTVRVTWPKGLNKLSLMQSSDETFDGSDVVTDMTGNTITVNGVVYNYADVTLSDGQYFTFAAFVQAPGGVVANLLMWHKANDGVTTAGQKDIWKDLSPNQRDVIQTNNANYRPALVTDATYAADSKNYFFNFNPFYYFDGSNDFFNRQNDDYFPTVTSAGSSYGVMFNSASGGWRTPYGWGDDDPNLNRAGDNYSIWRENGQVIDQNLGLTTRPAHIGGMAWKGGGAANNGIYLNMNGRIYGTTTYNIGNLNDASNFAIGSEGFALTGNGNELFQGGISEVFAYSADHQNSAGNEKQRINSYLALKYGITLSNDAGTGVPDYLSSTSAVIWNGAGNAPYGNNIAGIGADYNSALDQRQSISENDGKQVVISTPGLANTNALNAQALNNGQFLLWGDNGLAKAPSVYNPGINASINMLFKAIWKVQNTGSVGTVRVAWPAGLKNLSLIQSADQTFDGSDQLTPMSGNTQTINGVAYNYADVTLADGQYFTFASLIEHAPGGVFAGLSHWYRADIDATNTGDGTDLTAWKDYTSGVVSAQISTAPIPKYKQGAFDYLNFNPGVNFTATNQVFGNITEQTLTSLNFNIFTATKEGMAGSRYFNIGMDNTTFNGTNWDQPGLYADGGVARRTNTGAINALTNPGSVNFSTTQPNIAYFTFWDLGMSKGMNGAPRGAAYTHSAIGSVTGGHIFGSNGITTPPGGDDGGIIGNIGEVIVYGADTITTAERNRVDSYLAIKYGVTLNNGVNYVTSAGTTVWDKTQNSAYYNNVAGIGRDEISALHQKQSRSQASNANNQVIMALGTVAATNAANASNLADGQFLLWGDNGNTQAMTNSASTYTTFAYSGNTDNRRMNRIWKVQNTGVGQSLTLRFPVASVGTTTITGEGSCAKYVLLFASDPAFTSNVSIANLTVNGTNYDAAHTFPAGASYFTYAKVSSTVDGQAYLPSTTESTVIYSNCTSGGWNYFLRTSNTANKVLAFNGLTNTQLSKLTVTITPQGVNYVSGTRKTNLMPRQASVADADSATYSGVKVRVYYSPSELAATQLPGAVTNGWFKYEGTAGAVISDLQADGVFTFGKAVPLTPAASGVEDGVNYVEFHNITKFSSFVYVSSTELVETVLPVKLVQFKGEAVGDQVALSWTTSNEEGSKGFEIERSINTRDWANIGFVSSKGENGNGIRNYGFTDVNPSNGTNYYRLKQIDFNGDSEYSRTISVSVAAEKMGLVAYPNPAGKGELNFLLKHVSTPVASVRVYAVSGAEMSGLQLQNNVLNVKNLASGMYLLKVTLESGDVLTTRFAVQ